MVNVLTDIADSIQPTWCQQLRISGTPVAFMPYQQFRISIYESVNTFSDLSKKYYYGPVSTLEHGSSASFFNEHMQQAGVSLKIELWNEDLEKQIFHYLKKTIGSSVDKHNIQPIPFNKILLSSISFSTNYQLNSNWISYQLHTTMWFKLICSSKKKAIKLAEEIQKNPEHCTFLSSLRIMFGLTSAEPWREKEIMIRPENVRSGQLFRKIGLQKFPLATSVLLTGNTLSTLLSETVKEVINFNFSQNDVICSSSEAIIYTTVESILEAKEETIEMGRISSWEMVFWNEEKFRPDRAAQTISDIYNHSTPKTQELIRKAFTATSDFKALLASKICNKEKMKVFEVSKNRIEWYRDRFIPKTIKLYRINLSNARTKFPSQDGIVSISYSSACHVAPINFKQDNAQPLAPIDVASKEMKNLHLKLRGMEEQLHQLKESECYFNASRKSRFNLVGSALRYEALEVNLSSMSPVVPMNIESGTFTAPRGGLYQFNFSGYHRPLAGTNNNITVVELVCNGDVKETAEAKSSTDDTLIVMNRMLRLEAGQRTFVRLRKGLLRESESGTCTRFSGALLHCF